MSYYKDIYNDFPLRCAKLWKMMRKQAEDEKLDVTFMLMTAAAGFATPWEHLKIEAHRASDNKDHPAFNNFNESVYKNVLTRVKSEFDVVAHKSTLFKSIDLDKWFYSKTEDIASIRDRVEGHQRKDDVRELKARDVIKLLRNAIAHNNIYAFNRKAVGEIDELAFFSEWRDKTKERKLLGYDVLAIPSSDLGCFLDAWFDLLKEADPQGKVSRLAVSEALGGDDDRIAA